MNALDIKRPSIPSGPSSQDLSPFQQLKRSYDDAQLGWHGREEHATHNDPLFFNEDGSRKIVKKRRVSKLEMGGGKSEEPALSMGRYEGNAGNAGEVGLIGGTPGTTPSLSASSIHNQVTQAEPHGYSQINNLLNTLHHLRVPLQTSPTATQTSTFGSTAASTSSPSSSVTSQPAALEDPEEAAKVQQQYQATNRVLGALAQARLYRIQEHDRAHSEQEEEEPDSEEVSAFEIEENDMDEW